MNRRSMKRSISVLLDDETCTKKSPCIPTSNEEGKNNYMISSFRQRRPNLNPDPSSTSIIPNYNLQEVVMEQKSDNIDPYYHELFEEENGEGGGGGDSIDVSNVGKSEEEEESHDESNKRNSKRRGEDVSIEEDIGLNEAMLESLHVKLISLEEEIAHERYVLLVLKYL